MNIFYLEWIHKRPTVCEFRNTRPKDFTYHTQINIRGFKDVFERIDIYGNINPEFKNYEFPQNPYYTKRSFLISHLQKSIRKMLKSLVKSFNTYIYVFFISRSS